MSCQEFLSINSCLSDSVQVVADDAPANPTLHAILPMVVTAVQVMSAFQPADTSFDAGPPVTTTPKPPLALIGAPRRGLATSLGQHDATHAALFGDLLIRRCRDLAIGYQQVRCASELADMVVQAWHQLGCIVWIPRQDRITADDSAFDLIQPDYAAELGRFTQLATTNDRGMWFE